ncbi:MAG: dicarboxylate/amino acid:cation symporter, partial [Planctomycetota bacterium]
MIKLWHLTLAALPLGVVIGFAAPDLAIAIEPMGLVFLRLIKMLIPLLVFATVVTGIVSVDKLSSLASIGTKAVLAYGVTTLFAIFWGISLGALSGVGSGGDIRLEPSSGLDTPEPLSMYDSLIQWIPVNPLASFVDGNILQILTFSVLFAVALLMVGAHGRPIVRAVESLSHVMLAMTSVVMLAAPIGVCALIAIAIARHGADVLTTLSSLLAVYLLGCLFQIVIVYGVIVRFLVGMSFAKFIRGMLTPMSVAIGTTSSAATLPTTIQSVEDEFGVPRRISGFVLPLGAT